MNIQKIRKDRGLTQKKLADKIGVKASTLSKYEKDYISPNAEILKRIAEALSVTVDDLYEDNNHENSNSEKQLEFVAYVSAMNNKQFTNFLKKHNIQEW